MKRSYRHFFGNTAAPRNFRPCVEQLEARRPLAANLEIVSASIVDFSGSPAHATFFGEQVFVKVTWKTSGLSAQDKYVVRGSFGGIPIDSVVQAGLAGPATTSVHFGGWFATTVPASIKVTLDPDSVVEEVNETDNILDVAVTPTSPVGLPSKLTWPIGGQAPEAWGNWPILYYFDVDTRSGILRDYQGGLLTKDQHYGWDLGIGTYRMDAGTPVIAVTSGTVVQVIDGNYDREFSPANPTPDNNVYIDHGNGWRSSYFHMARGSITVRVGDTVVPGQVIGLVGSSGNSYGPHLHFGLSHNRNTVETYYAPDRYWEAAFARQSDQQMGVMDFGITNLSEAGQRERRAHITKFPIDYAGVITLWYTFTHFNAGDVNEVKWYRPNGSLASVLSNTIPSDSLSSVHVWNLSSAWVPGTWYASINVNGVEKARVPFMFTATDLVPEIRVTQGATPVTDERTTPIAFGTTALGNSPQQRTFTIQNHGYADLAISSVKLPPGFTLIGDFPTSIVAGQSVNVTLQLVTETSGYFFGSVVLLNNDPDEGEFRFNVEGTITGVTPSGAPVVALPSAALAYEIGGPDALLDSQATVTDANSANFSGGSLTVDFAGGNEMADSLAIRNQGTASGEIGVTGTTVTFGGIPIGTVTGGTGGQNLTIALNTAATPTATQSILRSLTFRTLNPIASVAPRYLRISVTDDTGRTSMFMRKTVVAYNLPPVITGLFDCFLVKDQSQDIPFAVSDTETPPDHLVLSVVSDNPAVIREQDCQLLGSGATRVLKVIPVAGQTGTATLTIQARDLQGNIGLRSVRITVNSNDPPTIADILDQTMEEDGASSVVVMVGDIDTAIADLVVSASSDNGTLLPPGSFAVSGTGTNRTLQITPLTDQNGSAVVTVTVSDGRLTSSYALSVIVGPVNDAPSGDDGSVTMSIGMSYTFALDDFGFSDVRDVPSHAFLGIQISSLPLTGLLTYDGTVTSLNQTISVSGISAGKFQYLPSPTDTGVLGHFTFRVQDSGGTVQGGVDVDPSPNIISLNALPPNVAPTFIKGPNQVAHDNSGPQSIIKWATGMSVGPVFEEKQRLRFVINSNTKPSIFKTEPVIDAEGNLTYTPAPNAHGIATITVQLQDDGGTAGGGADTSAAASFDIIITKPQPWHNTLNGLDVTGAGGIADGAVVAADVLAIINYINSSGSGAVPVNATPGPPYVDTTGGPNGAGDNMVVASDALAVINYINAFGSGRPGPSGEGEAALTSQHVIISLSADLISLLALDVAGTTVRRRRLWQAEGQ